MDASGKIQVIETEKRASFVKDVRRQSFYDIQRNRLAGNFKQDMKSSDSINSMEKRTSRNYKRRSSDMRYNLLSPEYDNRGS